MNRQFRYRQIRAGNPLANALVVIVGIVVISLSLALGFVVFIGMAGLMLVMAVLISVRAWWLKKRFGAPKSGEQAGNPGTQETHRVIEGEYHEVGSRDKEPHNR